MQLVTTIKGLGIACLTVGALYASESAASRLKTSEDVLTEIMSAPDKGIPQELLEKAQCVVIVPGLKKGAFVVGGEFGRGFVECRKGSGAGWRLPRYGWKAAVWAFRSAAHPRTW